MVQKTPKIFYKNLVNVGGLNARTLICKQLPSTRTLQQRIKKFTFSNYYAASKLKLELIYVQKKLSF